MNQRFFVAILFLILTAFLISLTTILGQNEFSAAMNASIQQPICIQISGNYSNGIYFTNTTTKGIQYPITAMNTYNNATANYLAASDGTAYFVQACSGNTIDVKVAHCACDDLLCSSGDCTVDIDKLYVSYSTDGGVGWANGTTATFNQHSPINSNYFFPGIDQYQLITGNLTPSSYIYMRYWIDPRPNSAPSGVYNTTFKIRAVEISTNIGTCTC